MRTFFKFVIWIFLLSIAALAGYFFLWPDGKHRNILSFIPRDFVYAVESNRPVESWREFSDSQIWQYLKRIDYLEEVSSSADTLDLWLKDNQKVLDLVKLGDMVISAHLTSPNTYEYIVLVDLREKNLNKFKQVIILLFKQLDYTFTTDSYFNIDIYDLFDEEEETTLSLAIVDNILIATYDKELLKKSVLQSEEPSIVENKDFALVRERTYGDGAYTLYLNYALMNNFVSLYTEQIPELLIDIPEILSFSSFEISLRDELAVMQGFLKHTDSVASLMNVFLDVGQGESTVKDVLPRSTAFYTSLGFEDFSDLYQRFEEYYQSTDSMGYLAWKKNQDRVEGYLGIDFDEHFFSWMTEEAVAAIIPTYANEDSFISAAFLHFDDYDLTLEQLNFVERRVRKRTPLKFETIDYRGFQIKHLEVKPFFKLFLRGLFSTIQQPHYTIIDDYVVFGNDTSSLKRMIDDYLQEFVLRNDDAYNAFVENFSSRSNIFLYIQQKTFYPYFRQQLDAETQAELARYKSYFLSFPQIGFQLHPGGQLYEAFMLSKFSEEYSDVELWE